MILLSSPLKNDPLETTVSIFFLEIEIFTTKTVNSKSLKKVCRQLLSTMNVLNIIIQHFRGEHLKLLKRSKFGDHWFRNGHDTRGRNLPFKEKSSNHFKDLHKLKLMTNLDLGLTSSPGGVTNLTFSHMIHIRHSENKNFT